MQRFSQTIALVMLVFVAASQPARPQGQAVAPPPAPAVTAAQAQQALDILQDDNKRAQLLQTLQTIAKATPASAAGPNAPSSLGSSRDNLGVQLLAQVSDWFGDVSSQLAMAARTVSDFPTIARWFVQLTTDPNTRRTLLDAAWKLALVIACAFAAEWLTRRAVGRPMAAIDGYMPARARRRIDDRPAIASGTVSTAEIHELRRWHATLGHAWQLALRLPFCLARLFLDLLPVVCFAAIGNLLLATDIGGEITPRVVILAIVNAYVLCRGILCVTAAVVSPSSSQPSLLVIRDETAAYIDVCGRASSW